MKKNVLPWLMMLALFASCSSAYRTTQTPDDVYYSPGKAKEYAATKGDDSTNNTYSRNSRRSQNADDYQDYTSSSDDNYLRMKIQNRYQWNSLDDYDYWYSPNYAYNNYYGFNSFNPYMLNTWGLSYYYSPFASIQPYSWFNNYYPSYGYGYGYSPYSGGFYGHDYGYGYYGYSPINVIVVNNRTRTSRPLLGGYTNNSYNNYNSNSNRGGRYVQPNNGYSRYNNTNNSARYDNSSRYNNNTNTNTYTPPARSYTPSSSGSSSGGSGSVSRPVRH